MHPTVCAFQVVFHTSSFSIKFLKWMSTYFGSTLNWNLLSRNGKSALQIARERKRSDMANEVHTLMRQAISSQDIMDDLLMANQMIDLAKFGSWNQLKADLKLYPRIVNCRPPNRKFAILHQVVVSI